MPTGVYKRKNGHGLYHSRFYSIYRNMLSRTRYNKGTYKSYFGKKCLWDNFLKFRDDMYKSYLEHCDKFGIKNTTLDRINGKGDYCKENCRWATYREQANNTSRNIKLTFYGLTLSVSEWSIKLNVPRAKINKRNLLGWSVNQIFDIDPRPLRSGCHSPSWKGGISTDKKHLRELYKKYREKNKEKIRLYQLNYRKSH